MLKTREYNKSKRVTRKASPRWLRLQPTGAHVSHFDMSWSSFFQLRKISRSSKPDTGMKSKAT